MHVMGQASPSYASLSVLEYFIVYGTTISIWVTLIGEYKQHCILTLFRVWGVDLWGCCCGINQDHGIYSGPIGSAVFIITVRVLQKMKEIKDLYQRRAYTQLVGPGCCFGALTLMLRFYFQFLSPVYLSFVLLLPKMNRYAGTDDPAKLSCYILFTSTMHMVSVLETYCRKHRTS
uniref:Uncharacterized protein n=1 Tax=Oncorhynchus tshawytscha TaxID=74940 RepID=A0A8C8IK46_ONCTS